MKEKIIRKNISVFHMLAIKLYEYVTKQKNKSRFIPKDPWLEDM